MAPERSNADGADSGDGVESDRKVRRVVSAESREFSIDLNGRCPAASVSLAGQKTAGGEEKEGSNQQEFTRTSAPRR